jgi:ABC-type transport system involved in multi-copper enzyme maturation permease subunit
MRFLSVADRELRSAARQKSTYRTRWLTAALFFGLLVWLLWVSGGFTNKGAAPKVFNVFSFLTFLYCLFLGTGRTADCISAERREGTLGLLFLTNLNSAEIIAGKLCSSALASVYGLMAIFPMLALPLLMGGITFGNFGRVVLGLLNGILFALAAGFLASVVCKRQFTAIALALGLTLAVAVGLILGAAAANSYRPTRLLANWVAIFSPFYALIAADGRGPFGRNLFWLSAALVAGISLGALGLTTLLLSRSWRDRPKSARAWYMPRFWKRSERTASVKHAALRRRLLAINPLFWLAGRQTVSAPVFMAIAVVLTSITVYVEAPMFGRIFRGATANAVLGYLFAWLWTGLAIHALVLYYAAMSASQRLAEDKQAGALELILSTPTTERTISRGLWLGFWRKMLFPALLAVLVHFFFIWMVLVMAVLDPPGPMPAGVTPGEIFWSGLLNKPLRGQVIDWQFGFLLRCAMLLLLLLMMAWPTLGWVGRWLGLRMKRPGFAPVTSLALLVAPIVLMFSLACYLSVKFHLDRLPERRFLPMLMWAAFVIGSGHCLALSVWASSRLRHHLRSIAMSRYQPLPSWRWRLPSRRLVLRFAIATAVFAIGVPSLVLSYYGYQNWSSRRAWRNFQAGLKQSGEPVNLSSLLPGPVPDDANFARSPAFLALLSKTNRENPGLFERISSHGPPSSPAQGNTLLMEWTRQAPLPLHAYLKGNFASPKAVPTGYALAYQYKLQRGSGSETNRSEAAMAILQDLQPRSETMRELAEATLRLPALQLSTNRDARAVLYSDGEPSLLIERLHLLFQIRACASLALDRNADAAEDLLTGFRLARLARQLPDARSTVRVQELLMRSLQSLWEGLNQQAWTDPQLAAFQHELAGFALLADYTNAIRRVVLANIEVWRTIPDSTNPHISLPASGGGYMSEPAWQFQPRAWWFDSCIQLHNAGRTAIEQVDVASGRFQQNGNWSEMQGLPLDSPSRDLLQTYMWWGGADPKSIAFAQTSVSQAIVACALERFRLENGAYPAALQQLVPAFLNSIPRDPMTGRPVIYQFPEPGRFILRGVGPNGVDDRKLTASDDWLWTYSTNSPSAKK